MSDSTRLDAALRALQRHDVDAAAAAAARGLGASAAAHGLLDVAYATLDSPLGPLITATTPRGVVLLAYEHGRRDTLLDQLASRVSPRVLEAPARVDAVRRQLDEYFAGRRRAFDLTVDWALTTPFGRRVLQTAVGIGFGTVSTYREVAGRAGNPRASRAVGSALGANPVCIVVPCHRVLRSDGGLGGYATGVDKKAFLLRHEGVALP